MSLVINTIEDFVHILETNPEWRQRVRRALFDDDREASRSRLEEPTTDFLELDRQLSDALATLHTDSQQRFYGDDSNAKASTTIAADCDRTTSPSLVIRPSNQKV